MKRQIVFTVTTLCLLLVSSIGYTAQEAPKVAMPEPFTVRAVLVDAQGKGIPSETVYCLIFTGGAAYTQLGMVDGRITPINPKAISGKNGELEIKVDGGFIQRHQALTQKFTIGVVREGKPIPMRVNGVQAVFDLDLARKAKNVVDLGKVTLQLK
jgi:hypothetical protein